MLKEVRIGKYLSDLNDERYEPMRSIELDPYSTRTAICDVKGDKAVDILGNSYYIVKRNANESIEISEAKKLRKGIEYVISVDNSKKFTSVEQKEFYKNLKIVLALKRKYIKEDEFEKANINKIRKVK